MDWKSDGTADISAQLNQNAFINGELEYLSGSQLIHMYTRKLLGWLLQLAMRVTCLLFAPRNVKLKGAGYVAATSLADPI